MRLFIGTLLSRENQASLGSAVRDLLSQTSSVLRAVPAGTAHLTFSFIAHAGDSDLAGITEALRRVAFSRAPIAMELTGARILGAGPVPRMVYAPVSTGHADLEELAADIQRALVAAVPRLEPSPTKSPHVTLARFRKTAGPADAERVERALAASPLAALVVRDVVSSLQLVHSTLTPEGPEYEEIAAVELGQREKRR